MDRKSETKTAGSQKVEVRGGSEPAEILAMEAKPDECRCRCDWCRDRRYYLIHHPAAPTPLPIKPRDPKEEARWHGGKECRNRYPCDCHCPFCHFREAHYVHFHLSHWTDEESQYFLEAQRAGSGKTMVEIRTDRQ